MSKFIVNQALKIVIETSVIPGLEAKIRKLEKYKTLYENAFDTITKLDISHYEDELVCYECMKLVDYEHVYECCGCRENICLSCVPKFARRICKICIVFAHLKCDSKKYHCDKCDGCLFCCKCTKSVAID